MTTRREHAGLMGLTWRPRRTSGSSITAAEESHSSRPRCHTGVRRNWPEEIQLPGSRSRVFGSGDGHPGWDVESIVESILVQLDRLPELGQDQRPKLPRADHPGT